MISKGKSKKQLKFESSDDDRIVNIHESIPPIETTLDLDVQRHQKLCPANNWVNKIRQIYYVNKKPKTRVIAGVHAEYDPESNHYLLQICIGNHCLFYLIQIYESGYVEEPLPKALVDLLLDGKTVVAADGLQDLEERLAETFGLRLPRTMDLNAEAAVSVGLARDGCGGCGLMKLAKMVLRDEGDLDWDEVLRSLTNGDERCSVSWWRDYYELILADVKVRCGTFQAFLARRMGVKFQADNKLLLV